MSIEGLSASNYLHVTDKKSTEDVACRLELSIVDWYSVNKALLVSYHIFALMRQLDEIRTNKLII